MEAIADARFGSKADMCGAIADVGLTPESGHSESQTDCPLSANSGHSQDDLRNRKTAASRPLLN